MSESDVVATLKKSVERGLRYLEVVGDSSNPKIGIWTSREVLCHLIYWHRATAEGMELSLIHICRCRRLLTCRSRWSPYH